MRNAELWRPTKFVLNGDNLTSSRNPADVAECSRFFVDLLAKHYWRLIRAHASGRLLDLGCGHVPLYGTYRDRVSEVVCVDWADTLHKNPHLDYELDLNEPLPFECKSFDTILLTDVLEHVPEPRRVLEEIARLLRNGGKLLLGVPFLYWLHETPHDYYRYTSFALRRLCEQSDMSVLELDPLGGLPEVFVDLSEKLLTYLPSAAARAMRPIVSSMSLLTKNPLCRRVSRATREEFPLAYVLVAQKNARSMQRES